MAQCPSLNMLLPVTVVFFLQFVSLTSKITPSLSAYLAAPTQDSQVYILTIDSRFPKFDKIKISDFKIFLVNWFLNITRYKRYNLVVALHVF